MAINLASKYSGKIAEVFSNVSYIKGKTSEDYDLTGVKTLKVFTPLTVPETEYVRQGQNRYGIPIEMQDTVQELKMTQDRSFTLTIDKGNNQDQELIKKAGDMLRLQISEQSTPAADKYALNRFANMAGTVAGIEKPTKNTIVEAISDGVQALDDNFVPNDGRYLYLSSDMYKLLCVSPEFTHLEGIGTKALEKGVCGEIFGLEIVKVPKSYMPINTFFIITHKSSILFPYKIADAKVHENPVGISGALIEGRHYYDAFVLGAKCMGVYVAVLAGEVMEAPSISLSGSTATISGTGDIYVTVDGSDPRYSDSAFKYTEPTEVSENCIKAYSVSDGKFPSPVTIKCLNN